MNNNIHSFKTGCDFGNGEQVITYKQIRESGDVLKVITYLCEDSVNNEKFTVSIFVTDPDNHNHIQTSIHDAYSLGLVTVIEQED